MTVPLVSTEAAGAPLRRGRSKIKPTLASRSSSSPRRRRQPRTETLTAMAGRQPLRLGETSLVGLGLALVLYGVLRHFHGALFGGAVG